MPEIGANAAADAVGEAALGANVVEQARRKAAAESFVENADGVVVGIVARGSERDHVNVALVHILFRDQIVAGLGGLVLNLDFSADAGPFGHESNAARSLASIAAESKSPLMPRMMLLGWT